MDKDQERAIAFETFCNTIFFVFLFIGCFLIGFRIARQNKFYCWSCGQKIEFKEIIDQGVSE